MVARALAAVGVAVLAAGCGSASTGSGQTPAASLKRAAYVSTSAPGYRAAMTMTETISGASSGSKTIALTANGSFSPASRVGDMTMAMQIPTAAGTQNFNMQLVLEGDTIYVKMPAALASKLPGDKPWFSMNLAQMGKASGIPGYGSLLSSSSNFSNPSQYLDLLRATADGSVKDLGQETIDGVQTTHYQAQVDIAKLPNVVPAADRQAAQQLVSTLQSKGVNTQMPVDTWIDGSHRIRRIHITYSLSLQGESVAVDITENLSDYGSQPAPTAPSADETTNLLSLIHG